MGDERDREFMDESAKELIKISISMKERLCMKELISGLLVCVKDSVTDRLKAQG